MGELQAEIGRLQTEIRKKDKQLIKKVRAEKGGSGKAEKGGV